MGEDIRLKSKAGEIGAYLATPKGTAKGGVVVIQEIFGVNHHIKAVTDKFAADGYIALAPRFFDHTKTGIELGYTPDTIAEGRKYVTELGLDKPVQDVEAAIEEAVPAEVLAASLFVRFRSRQDHTFAEKMLSAMRQKFGGHVEPKAAAKK